MTTTSPMSSVLFCIFITVYIFGNIARFKAKTTLKNVQHNWSQYRCNPLFMPFADNVEQNFFTCVQSGMKTFIPFFLNPLNSLLDKLTSIASDHSISINSFRISHFNLRSLLSNTFLSMIGVFESMGVEFVKTLFGVSDLISKFVAIGVSIMYIFEATIDTVSSTWNGPPGQMIRKLQSMSLCFHPLTPIELINGNFKAIKDICRNDILKDGSTVLKPLLFYNIFGTPFYSIGNIQVTGRHKIWSRHSNTFVYVCQHEDVVPPPISNEISEYLICLITDTGIIAIDNYIFRDWNDD